MKNQVVARFDQLSTQIGILSDYFKELESNADTDVKDLHNLPDTIDSYLNENFSDEFALIGTTLKIFTMIIERCFSDQKRLYRELVSQIADVNEKRLKSKQKVDELEIAYEKRLNEFSSESEVYHNALRNAFEQMVNLNNKFSKGDIKKKEMMTKLYNEYCSNRDKFLDTNSQLEYFMSVMNKQEEEQYTELAKSEEQAFESIHVICGNASNTICMQYQSVKIPEKKLKLEGERLKLKFRDFKKPVFKPYKFTNKIIKIRHLPVPAFKCQVIPYGIAQLDQDITERGIVLKEGTRLLLLDDSQREYVPVAVDGKTPPFFVLKSNLKNVIMGMPKNFGQININDY